MKQKDLFKNGHAFLILPVILISIMVFIPMVLALITSFQSGPPVNMTFNGLGNYQRMLTDATFKKAFFNTFLYLLVQVPIMLFLALFISNLLNDKKLKYKRVVSNRYLSSMYHFDGQLFSDHEKSIFSIWPCKQLVVGHWYD